MKQSKDDAAMFALAAALASYHGTRQAILDAEKSDGEPRPQLLAGAWRDYTVELARLKIKPTYSGLKVA